MSHPQDLPLREQAKLIAQGSLDPKELLEHTLGRLLERNPPLNAVIATFPAEAEAMLTSAPQGPLHGVPVTIKDMFSLPWRGYHNGTHHELGPRIASGVFQRLRDAGAVIVGVDNQHELGMGTTGIASAYGPTRNPWNPAHCAGGSSSGSAAAVASRMIGGSVGSDSGGSTRLPAGWCGVVGLKVTYGSLPYDGYTGANSTLSAPGAFGRDASDARLLLEALLARPLPTRDGGALRVGIVRHPYWDDIDPEVDAACREALNASQFTQTELQLPFPELIGPAGALRAGAELGVAVPKAIFGELDPVTRGLLQFSAMQPAQRLIRADRIRARLRRALVDAFASCELLAWPTNPAPAPPLQEPLLQLPSGPSLADPPNVLRSVPANLAGVPGVSLPVGFHSSGLPIGLQLLAPWNEESLLLDAVQRIEDVTDRRWVEASPPVP
jgi:Asp-tRNA(Asn)/Glu-tRNA(Gln) amidotransferase A subunit family amidase